MTSEQRSETEATNSVFAELQLSTRPCWNDFDVFESIFPRSEGTKETEVTAMLVLVMYAVRDERLSSLNGFTKTKWFLTIYTTAHLSFKMTNIKE